MEKLLFTNQIVMLHSFTKKNPIQSSGKECFECFVLFYVTAHRKMLYILKLTKTSQKERKPNERCFQIQNFIEIPQIILSSLFLFIYRAKQTAKAYFRIVVKVFEIITHN